MGNYPMAVDATNAAIHSQGSAMRENEEYMKSLQARIEKMKAQWQELALVMGDAVITDSLIAVLTALTGLGKFLAIVIDRIGLLPFVFGTATLATHLLSAKFQTLIFNTVNTIRTMHGLPAIMAKTTVATGILAKAVRGLSFVFKGLAASVGVGLVFMGIELLINKLGGAKDATEDAIDTLESSSNASADLQHLKQLSATYDELKNVSKLTTDEKLKLINVEQTLSDKFGISTESLLKNNGAYESNNELIKEAIELKEKENAQRNKDLLLDFEANESKINKEIETNRKSIEEQKKLVTERQTAYDELKRQIENQEKINPSSFFEDGHTMPIISPDSKQYEQYVQALKQMAAQGLQEATSQMDGYVSTLNKNLDEKAKGINARFSILIQEFEENGTKVKSSTSVLFSALAEMAVLNDLEIDDTQLRSIFQAFNSAEINNIGQLERVFKNLPVPVKLTGDELTILSSIMSRLKQNMHTEEVDEYGNAIEGAATNVKDLKEELLSFSEVIERSNENFQEKSDLITGIDKVMRDYAKGNKVSASEVQKLINADQSLAKSIDVVNGEIRLNIRALEDKKKAELNALNRVGDAWIANRIRANDYLNQILKNSKLEIESIMDVQEAYGLLENRLQSASSFAEGVAISESMKVLDELAAIYRKRQLQLEEINQTVDENKKKENESRKETEKTIKVLTELQKKLENVENAIQKLQSTRYKLNRSSKAYRDSLAAENRLLAQQAELHRQGIANPRQLIENTVSDPSQQSSSTTATSSTKVDAMLSAAQQLSASGRFKYKQVGGEFKGTYDEFVKGAVSDCSQFVQEMFKEFADVKLPRVAADQAKQGTAVSKKDLQKGDLVYFDTMNKSASHIGIYMGDSKFVHMGSSGMKVDDLNSSYWSQRYEGARRISGLDGTTTSTTGSTTTSTNNEPTARDLEQARIDEEKKLADNQQRQYQNRVSTVQSFIDENQKGIDLIDAAIHKSQYLQSSLAETDQKWRNQNLQQFDMIGQKQDALHKQNNMIKELVKNYDITSGDFDSQLASNSREWLDLQEARNELINAYIQSFNTEIQNKFSREQAVMGRKISLLGEISSEEDQKKLEKYSSELLDSLRKEHLALFNEVEKLRKTIADPKASSAMKIAAQQLLDVFEDAANEKNLERVNQAAELGKLQAESLVYGFNKQIEELEYQTSLLGDSEEDKEKTKKLAADINKIRLEAVATQSAEILELERKLTTELSNEERSRVQAKLNALNASYRNNRQAIANYDNQLLKDREEWADKIIENYKRMLEQEKKLHDESIKKQREAENKRHDERIKNLTEEFDQFEDGINAQLKSLERDNESEDHNENLDKLLEERNEIQRKHDLWLNSDSFEAIAKRKQYQEELDKKEEEIRKAQIERERQLQKQSLQDQLDDRRKTIDKEKKAEDDFNRDQIKGLDDLQKHYDQYYEGLLSDEKHFFEMKKHLMSEDSSVVENELNNLREKYGSFFDFLDEQIKNLENTSDIYGKRILENLFYSTKTGFDKIDEFSNNYGNGNSNGGSNNSGNGSNNNSSPPKNTTPAFWQQWNEYLNNKKQAEAMGGNKGQAYQDLKARNDILRDYYKFADGSYEELSKSNVPLFSAETGGMTPAWGKSGKFLLAHEKEIVLNKHDSKNFLEAVKMSRTIDSLPGLSSSSIGNPSRGSVSEDNSINLNFHIDKVIGDETGARMLVDTAKAALQKARRRGEVF